MGGAAFSAGPDALSTPRMPPRVYHAVKDICNSKLSELFLCVATPIEGPDKKDHGDIDFLVAWEKRAIFPRGHGEPRHEAYGDDRSVLDAIQVLLGSERAILVKGQDAANMAIPWPEHLLPPLDDSDSGEGNEDDAAAGAETGSETQPRRYIQVDVRVCQSLDKLQWMLFKHAHGDIWNLLGSIIRRFGLTIDEDAMWLRTREIEDFHRNRAKIHITSDPAEVLHFLGLPIHDFWERPFPTAAALYAYVASTPFFWTEPRRPDADPDAEPDGTATATATDLQKLKANDRKRMKQRPLFRHWVDDFVPACRAAGRYPAPAAPAAAPTRDSTRAAVFARYPATRRAHDAALAAWTLERRADAAWNVAIKGTVPGTLEPSERGVVCGALKRIVLLDDASLGIVPARPLRDAEGLWVLDEVARFVAERWEEVGRAMKIRNGARFRERLAEKERERQRETGGEGEGEGELKRKAAGAVDGLGGDDLAGKVRMAESRPHGTAEMADMEKNLEAPCGELPKTTEMLPVEQEKTTSHGETSVAGDLMETDANG